MSDYRVKMGAKPETLEDYSFNIIGDLLLVTHFMERNEKERAEEWMNEIVLPQLEEYYKLNKDTKFGVFSDSQLWRKGDYKLYREELRKQYGFN